ncbi:hypothetical protein K5I29_11835 [Flavobacterium agricola]|uniref:Lipoprotein n=1 Tax=Flavobacterium agricola TaxID=2870839 RepID=A0ABY6LY79_9FLAO|nr:hypothetical protein [Flavobacterium agricola]UYW01141.1 hypothetical protein K5I29_11835 [Flavobacterium agricola]
MKYFVLVASVLTGLFVSCSADKKQKELADREQAEKITDSIVNAIYNQWNFTYKALTPETKSQTNDWQMWQSFLQDIKQKPSKSASAFIAKVDNLTRISDDLLQTVPAHLNQPQITARLNNLNTNLKYLNTFISLQTVPVEKVRNIQQYIISDINGINEQIDEQVRVQKIPTEKGEIEMIEFVKDTTRRANFNFENQIKQNQEAPKLNREGNTKVKESELRLETTPDKVQQEI